MGISQGIDSENKILQIIYITRILVSLIICGIASNYAVDQVRAIVYGQSVIYISR